MTKVRILLNELDFSTIVHETSELLKNVIKDVKIRRKSELLDKIRKLEKFFFQTNPSFLLF